MLHDPPPDKRPWAVLCGYLGRIARTRRNPASQTIILGLSQCSSTAPGDALPAILRLSHFPVTSGKSATFAWLRRLTGGLPDVGKQTVVRRNLIREVAERSVAARGRLQGAVIA